MRVISEFLDFVFYKTYCLYRSWGENDIPGIYALCVITLFPLLNLSSIIFILIDIFHVKNWNYSKLLILGSFLAVLAANYFRIYRHIGISNFVAQWDATSDKRKKQLKIGMIIYLIGSVVFLFISLSNWQNKI